MTDAYTQSDDERNRDALQVAVANAYNAQQERRARPRCTHTAENLMRMEGHCPACSPEQYAAQLVAAPDVNSEDA